MLTTIAINSSNQTNLTIQTKFWIEFPCVSQVYIYIYRDTRSSSSKQSILLSYRAPTPPYLQNLTAYQTTDESDSTINPTELLVPKPEMNHTRTPSEIHETHRIPVIQTGNSIPQTNTYPHKNVERSKTSRC